MKKLFLFLILIAPIFVQPINAQTNVSAFTPQYFIGTGVSFDYYGKTGFAAGTEFAARVSGPYYSFTTIELTRDIATLRTGAAYMFFQQGNWVMVALGDAGLQTGSGPTLGSFSGGGFLGYDIGGKITKGTSHFYVAVGGRLLNVTSQTVQPIATVVLGKAF